MPLSWTDQAVLSGLIIVCCIAVGFISNSTFVTSLLTIISVFCTLRYIVWRWSSSVSFLNNSGWHVDYVGLVFAFMLLCAETYSVLILLLGYFQSARSLKRRPVPLPLDTNLWPSVDVFIPTYNEPLEVVRPSVLAALGIDWPQDRINVYLLDDGRREQFREFAAECGVNYLTRFDNAHAKAGNINSALKTTHGEYIAIFDCDHIATRSFLQLTMGWFGKDARLAMVQTPHHFYSPDPFERNLNVFRKIPNEGSLFYGVVQDGNDLWNATFFCGSCAVIKRAALEQIGGIAVETVTEDAHTSIRLQRLGWNTAYIGIPQAAGLATGSLAAHIGQRIRWARGMVQILRIENPLFASGLDFPQRLCYLNCTLHYLYAIPRLIFVSAPLIYLLLGKSNLYGFIWEILAYAAPHLVLSSMVNSRSQGDHRHSFWNEVYEMVLSPYILLPTTLALINPKWGKFNVTVKDSIVEESFFDWKIARPYVAMIAINLVAIIVAVPRYFMSGDHSGILVANVIWALLNTLVLGACVAVSFETKQRRSTARVGATLTASLAMGPDDIHACRVIDLSEGGIALRSDRILDCVPGQYGTITIQAGDEAFKFAVETVRSSENRIHLRFPATDLKHQRAITKLVYSRADAWLDWTKDQRRDRILSSLINVFGIGARGIWMLPSLVIKHEDKENSKSAKAAIGKAVLPIGLLCMLLLPSHKAWGAQATVPGPAELAAVETPIDVNEETFRDTQSLLDLGRKTAFVLRGDKAKAGFSFVVPAIKIVDSADLVLYYSAGRPSEGALDVDIKLNDVEVSHIPLAASGAASNVAYVSLPPDLLVHDNALSFELQRECAGPCKSNLDSEFWVRIEPTTELRTSGIVMKLPNRLSMLPSPFFDPSVHRSIDFPIVFDSEPDRASLTAAGVIASWYGSMAGYRGTHFRASFGQFPKGNVILLAHSDRALAAKLGLSGQDAQLAIRDNPSDRYGKVLALVANSGADILRLSRLVAQNEIHDDTDLVTIGIDRLSSQPRAVKAPSWANTSKPLRITSDLNENLLNARIGSPMSLYFRIPADLAYGTKVTVPLHLAFKLSGLTSDDHVWMSIKLNDTFLTKRRLGKDDCDDPRTQSFAIPVSLLYAGNTLDIELQTNRSDTTVLDPDSVSLQVLPATDLDLQNPSHFVRMPRLDLFAASGFPFTSKLDLSETAVVMPVNPTPAQVGLFLDAIGFMNAQTGSPALDFHLTDAKDLSADRDRNFLVIGSSNDENVFRRFETSMVVIPASGRFESGETALPISDWLSRAWFGRTNETQKLAGLLDRNSDPQLLIEQFASPFRGDRSVVVLATRAETDDQPYFGLLSDASRVGLIHGGVVVYSQGRFTSFQMNPRSYVVGSQMTLAGVYDWLRFHLWILPIFLLAAAAIIARRWERLLTRQMERRLQVGVCSHR